MGKYFFFHHALQVHDENMELWYQLHHSVGIAFKLNVISVDEKQDQNNAAACSTQQWTDEVAVFRNAPQQLKKLQS